MANNGNGVKPKEKAHNRVQRFLDDERRCLNEAIRKLQGAQSKICKTADFIAYWLERTAEVEPATGRERLIAYYFYFLGLTAGNLQRDMKSVLEGGRTTAEARKAKNANLIERIDAIRAQLQQQNPHTRIPLYKAFKAYGDQQHPKQTAEGVANAYHKQKRLLSR